METTIISALSGSTMVFLILYIREKSLNKILVDRLLKVVEIIAQVQVMMNTQQETPVVLQSIKDKLDYVISSIGSVLSVLGRDYFSIMDGLLRTEFIPDSVSTVPYQMKVNGSDPVNVSFRRNAGGNLVFRQGSQNFSMDIITRNWIRIRRYDGTATQTPDNSVRVDLFRETPRRWISIDLKYILVQQ